MTSSAVEMHNNVRFLLGELCAMWCSYRGRQISFRLAVVYWGKGNAHPRLGLSMDRKLTKRLSL